MDAVDDDATELAALRRRAYGPNADIAADPAALERLIELEDAVRGQPADQSDATIETAEPFSAPGAAAAPVEAATANRPPRWHTMLVAAVGAIAVVLSAMAGFPAGPEPTAVAVAPIGIDAFLTAPSARVLVRIPINNTSGEAGTLSAAGSPPQFSIPENMQWVSPLGRYWGWQLWIARSLSGVPCMAVVRDAAVVARCVLAAEFDTGALVIAVPFAGISEIDRPEGMTPDQSIEFRWLPGEYVYAVLEPTAPSPVATTLAP